MAVNDVWEAQVSWQVGSVPTLNVLHFIETGLIVPGAGRTRAQAVAQAIHTGGFMGTMLDFISEEVELLSIYVRALDVDNVIPRLHIVGSAAPNVGAFPGPSCPPQVALIIGTYTTESDPPIFGGRIFVPGVPEGCHQEGVIDAASLSAFQTDADDLPVPFNAVGTDAGELTLAVYSVGVHAAKAVFDCQVRSNLGTHKSRRARPGVS